MQELLNVCLMNDSFPPIIDGVSNAVYNYARIIQESYGKAVVVTPQHPEAEDDYPFQVLRYPSIKASKLHDYRSDRRSALRYFMASKQTLSI